MKVTAEEVPGIKSNETPIKNDADMQKVIRQRSCIWLER